MPRSIAQSLLNNFLGPAAGWYKRTILLFLLVNPFVLWAMGPFIAGWLLVAEFIFCLAMALKCYPLQPGGLLAFQAVLLGLTSPATIYHETEANFAVILLLIFMVAGIFFLKDMLLYIFSKLLVCIRSKMLISLVFCATCALLSAFLDALTVTAVIITVVAGFYAVSLFPVRGWSKAKRSAWRACRFILLTHSFKTGSCIDPDLPFLP